MDDLTLAIGDALMGQALDGWEPTGEWREDLRAVGLRIHGAYVAHPQAAALTTSRSPGGPTNSPPTRPCWTSCAPPFPLADTVRIYHAFIDQTLAFAALDAASPALPSESLRADEDVWRSAYARLPRAAHPRIAEAAPLLATRMVNSAYPTALEMLLDSATDQLEALR